MVDFQFYKPRNRAICCDQTHFAGPAKWIAVGSVFVALIWAYAWMHNEILAISYDMEQLKQENAQLRSANNSLRTQIRTMVNPQRIEEAAQQIGLLPSNSSEVLILEGELPGLKLQETLLAESRRVGKTLHE